MVRLQKYPRTPHIQGSRLQPGDQDLEIVPFEVLRRQQVVVEEKVDGANAGLSFDDSGTLRLQSRGHFLRGGAREKQFHLFNAWAATHQHQLRRRLGSRYVVYGEWVYVKHTIFYDALPHYFLEFDVLDTEEGGFLSTERRRDLLEELPLVSVPVLFRGSVDTLDALVSLIGPSRLKTDGWRDRLRTLCSSLRLDVERVMQETDPTSVVEGLYIKVEAGDRVVARYKFVRSSFLTVVLESGSHWLHRPIIPNQLRRDVSLFGGAT